jgi:RNA polymerase sigma-70 factor (ECF subfamily)
MVSRVLRGVEAMHELTPEQYQQSRGDFADMSREWWRELFAELAEGRLKALERLYDVAARRLYGLALWHTGSPEDSGDVVQEVLVRVAEQRGRLAKIKNPRAWLLTVAYRLSVDVLRKRKRRPTEPLDQHPLLVASVDDSERAVDAERASGLLAGLPPGQRDAVYLRHFADCTFAEIGSIVGAPTFTVASRYRAGIRRLRLELERSP